MRQDLHHTDQETLKRLLEEYLSRQDELTRSWFDRIPKEEIFKQYRTYYLNFSNEGLMNPETIYLDWLDSRKYQRDFLSGPEPEPPGPNPNSHPPGPEPQVIITIVDEEPATPPVLALPQAQEHDFDAQIKQYLAMSDQELANQFELPPGNDIEENARQAIQDLEIDVKQIMQEIEVPIKSPLQHDLSDDLGR